MSVVKDGDFVVVEDFAYDRTTAYDHTGKQVSLGDLPSGWQEQLCVQNCMGGQYGPNGQVSYLVRPGSTGGNIRWPDGW